MATLTHKLDIFSDGGVQVFLPIPAPSPAGVRRKLRIWGDPVMTAWGYDINQVGQDHATNSNWQNISLWNPATGWGAVSNFLWIEREWIDYLQSLQFTETIWNGETHGQRSKMGWLCSDTGKIYIRAGEWETADKIGWGTTAIGGNTVTIDEIRVMRVFDKSAGELRNLEMARLRCFRKSDYLRPLEDMLAEGIVQQCFCVYKNNGFGDTPKGVIYSPMWSPLDWDFAGNEQPDSFWLPTVLMES